MRLRVLTPTGTILDTGEAVALRAADASGSFGIRPGHADFITVLSLGVLSWQDAAGAAHHVAVRGGVLRVSGGQEVEVATREARAGDDLAALAGEMLAEYARRDEEDARLRTRAARLHAAAIRQLGEVLESGRRPVITQPTPGFGHGRRRAHRRHEEAHR